LLWHGSGTIVAVFPATFIPAFALIIELRIGIQTLDDFAVLIAICIRNAFGYCNTLFTILTIDVLISTMFCCITLALARIPMRISRARFPFVAAKMQVIDCIAVCFQASHRHAELRIYRAHALSEVDRIIQVIVFLPDDFSTRPDKIRTFAYIPKFSGRIQCTPRHHSGHSNA
jgi:hypothetical protein